MKKLKSWQNMAWYEIGWEVEEVLRIVWDRNFTTSYNEVFTGTPEWEGITEQLWAIREGLGRKAV